MDALDIAYEEAITREEAAGRHECDGCPGDGIYRGRGIVENGVFKGVTGVCYRCGGKGYQTDADVRRCNYYDNRVRRYRL